MKQVCSTLMNEYMLPADAGRPPRPVVEVILVTAEPSYTVEEGERKGSRVTTRLVRGQATETLRFFATPDSLRQLAEQLLGYARAAEDTAACYESVETLLEPKPSPDPNPRAA